MVEKGSKGGICHAIHRYAKANNKYMRYYDENKEISYILYLDANNLHGLAMSQKLPLSGFKWVKQVSKIDEDFMKNCDEDGDIAYFLEVDIENPRELHDLHSDLPFLPERMKINICNKLVCILYDKTKYVVHIRALKQALKHGLKLKNVHKAIAFYQEAWLKLYIDMNTELRRQARNDFEKDLYKLLNNAIYGKSLQNVRKHRDIKLVTTDKRRNQLVSEPNYHEIKGLLNIQNKIYKVSSNRN